MTTNTALKAALLSTAMLISTVLFAKEFTQEEVNRFNQLINSANEIIEPLVLRQGSQLAETERKSLRSAIEMYKEAIQIDPQSWAPMWFKGKAYKAYGDLQGAYDSFKQAYSIMPAHPELVNEYILAAIHLNKTDEAFTVNSKAAIQFPKDLSIQANLALSMILVAQPTNAVKQGQKALAISPNDQFTLQLISIANEILAGQRRQPKDVFELSN